MSATAAGRRRLVGVVVSDRMEMTRVVRVTRHVRHPKYHRVIRQNERYKVHDQENISRSGDEVRIEETRPISKEKRWRLLAVIKKGEALENREAQRVAELEALGVQKKKEAPAAPEEVS